MKKACIMEKSKKLNIGCGRDIRKGWINLDSNRLPGVDVVHNIEHLPLPFSKEEFEEVLCQDVLEHILDYVPTLQEIHRILKKNGLLKIRVPHFTSRNNFLDPTHKRMFSIRTFDFFTEAGYLGRQYYFNFHYKKIVHSRITFGEGFIRRILEKLVNINNKTKEIYENTFLSSLMSAENIEIEMIK